MCSSDLLRLHAVGQSDDGALGAGNRALDSDQIVLGVNLDNGQVLHGDAHKAHVAGQASSASSPHSEDSDSPVPPFLSP